MFEEMVVSSPTSKKTNKPWTVVISMLLQVTFLAILILIPLIYTDALPKGTFTTMLVAPPPGVSAAEAVAWVDGAVVPHTVVDGLVEFTMPAAEGDVTDWGVTGPAS